MTNDARFWIEQLGLIPHPEGGYYRQTYRSEITIPREALPAGFRGARPVSTAIYFLLAEQDFSAFHRLRSDEMWHFYAGAPLELHIISAAGIHLQILLGGDVARKQILQAVVPAGCWFASRLHSENSFALVGCTVAPGFDFDDFEMARRAELTAQHPQYSEVIRALTRE